MAGQTQPLLTPNTGQGPSQWDKLLLLPPEGHGLSGRQQEPALTPLCIQKAAKVPSCFALCALSGMASVFMRSSVLVYHGKTPPFPANRMRFIEALLGSLKPRVKKLPKFSSWQVYKTDALP